MQPDDGSFRISINSMDAFIQFVKIIRGLDEDGIAQQMARLAIGKTVLSESLTKQGELSDGITNS